MACKARGALTTPIGKRPTGLERRPQPTTQCGRETSVDGGRGPGRPRPRSTAIGVRSLPVVEDAHDLAAAPFLRSLRLMRTLSGIGTAVGRGGRSGGRDVDEPTLDPPVPPAPPSKPRDLQWDIRAPPGFADRCRTAGGIGPGSSPSTLRDRGRGGRRPCLNSRPDGQPVRIASLRAGAVPRQYGSLALMPIESGEDPDCRPFADVAQLVEHFTRNEGVPGSSPGVGSKERPAESGPFVVYAGHDQPLGGASPLWRLMAPTTSRGQLRRREAGWEGSRRRNRDPRDTNHIGGGAVRASQHAMAKPDD